MKRLALPTIALLAFFSVKLAFCAGTTSANFLKLGVGARNAAMGETGATEIGVNAAWWNPAGLTKVESTELSFMNSSWFGDVKFQTLGFAHKMRSGTLGITAGVVSMTPIDKYDNSGLKMDETFQPQDSLLAVSYAKEIESMPENIPMGLTFKYISSRIDDATADSVAVDFGFFIHPLFFPFIEGLKAGVAVQNLGKSMKFNKKLYPLPLNIKVGASFPILANTIMAADINKCIDTDPVANIGFEHYMLIGEEALFSPRIGYRTNVKGIEDANGISFGIGLSYRRIAFDYAFVPYGELDNVNKLSILFFF
ncbi:MAG: PorV/PorQ family protein [Endomicrobiales bacterium]|nr:PorV/PorQ family protein [Endomicrobiales bacterium]